MSNYHQEPQAVYPPPGAGEKPGSYIAPAPAPPADYPMKYDPSQGQNPSHKYDTQSRGDGFWRGCCAGMCCCCLLDACF